MTGELLLGIDQGTGSTRVIAFDRSLSVVATAARPLQTHHPHPGWAEQDPLGILESVIDAIADVVDQVGGVEHVAAAGLDNQGETVVAWDGETLEPLGPAIVWQCRRSQAIVERIRAQGGEPRIRATTGLPLDAYYSSSKLAWLLEESERVRAARARGVLRLGTVDAWLTARLGLDAPAGRTDPSTASRTQLLDLGSLGWDEATLGVFGVDVATLPRLGPSTGHHGTVAHPRWGGAIAITALACDQQAALAGHAAFGAGAMKATYGTGVFVLANAGEEPPNVDGLETSVAWQIDRGRPAFVIQGGVLTAGALMGWLRDDLGLIDDAAGIGSIATSVPDTAGVRVLPALAGVGAPWYRPDARAVIAGLTGAADRRHVVRAAIDGICHRVCDIVEVMCRALPGGAVRLRVDGGLTRVEHVVQRQADLLGLPVDLATIDEATALGIAGLAGLGAGLIEPGDIAAANPVARRFEPRLPAQVRLAERTDWRRFVEAASEL